MERLKENLQSGVIMEGINERMQSEVLGMLSVLDLVDLQTVATRLMIEVTPTEQGNKYLLLRTILRFLNSEDVEFSPDGGLGIFADLHESITRHLNPEIPTKSSFYIPSAVKSNNPFKSETFWETESNTRMKNYKSIPFESSTPYLPGNTKNLIDFDSDLEVLQENQNETTTNKFE